MDHFEDMEQLRNRFSLLSGKHDQDPKSVSLANHLRGEHPDPNVHSALSQDAASPYSGLHTHNMRQEAPQDSNILDITMENDMNSRLQDSAANASVLPQSRTLYSAGASNLSPGNAYGNTTGRQGLRLNISTTANAVASAVSVFAHGTLQSTTSPEPSGDANKHAHGIALGLSSISTSIGISMPNIAGSHSPSTAQPGLHKGLGFVSGISAAAASAGYGNDSAKVTNPQSDQSSFNQFRMDTSNQLDEDDDAYNAGNSLYPHSPSRSPYLSPHSRPLTPNGEAQSPSAYPPPSPYPSPGLSPIALSPGPHSPGPESSGAEGDDASPTQTRGRLRGRRQKPGSSPHHPASAGPWSTGQQQQSQFVQTGVPGNVTPSRRADTVEERHSRNRGKSVGEGFAGSGSRGVSPYQYPTQGEPRGFALGRKLSASALQGSSPHRNITTGTSPREIPPLEIYNGSGASSRDHSVGSHDPGAYIHPYPHSFPQQHQQFQHPHSDQYLNPPVSPHSPHFIANVPAVGSPPIGMLHSPHSLSPHTQSPHSVPPPTPSPELGGPNLAGSYAGSVQSSPGFGPDQTGGTLLFAMDPVPSTIQLDSIHPPDRGAQYAQVSYPSDAQLTGTTDEFGMLQSSGSSAFPGTAGMDPAGVPQQFNINNMGLGAWPQDPSVSSSQLTEAHLRAFGNDTGTTGGNGPYTHNPPESVRANAGDIGAEESLDILLGITPSFWQDGQGFNEQSLNPAPNNATGGLGGNATHWVRNMDGSQNLSIDTRAMQQPNVYSLQQDPTQYQQYVVDSQTVPPSPAKGTMQPWDAQPTRQLPPGGVGDWRAQQISMQAPIMPQQDNMQQIPYNHPPSSNQDPGALSVPPRPTPTRRRSKSDPYNLGQHHVPQPPSGVSGYSTGQMFNSPKKHSNTLAPGFTMDFGTKQEDDIIYNEGPGLKLRKTLPTAHQGRGHRQTVSAVPSFVVSDWSNLAAGQPQNQHPHFMTSQSYQGPPSVSHGMAPPQGNHGGSQPGPSMYGTSSHHLNPQAPPLPHTMTYPPPNPMTELPHPGPSNFGRPSSTTKQKQQGQRNEVDEGKLAAAFLPGSFRMDPALRFFLDAIRNYPFYLNDEHEPLLGTPEAEQLLAQVRSVYPQDPRFAPRNDPRSASQPVDNETRDSQSIFMLFTETNQCLICGAQKDRTGRALGHVRFDIGHRPYHCSCEKCTQSLNPRRFFSDNLLDDHLKGQQVKQECIYCHNLFRRAGMKRHLTSKHPEHLQYTHNNQGDGGNELCGEDEDEGTSLYLYPSPADSRGRKLSASAAIQGSQYRNITIGMSPDKIPSMEIYNGSITSSREHSVGPDDLVDTHPYLHQYSQHQQFQHPSRSHHSPNSMANVPGVGSPPVGMLQSPHSLSPHTQSPHSVPPPTPSPELGGPNLAGSYGGSVQSSPGFGPDQMGGTLLFAMDPPPGTIQLDNIHPPDRGAQYAQEPYPSDAQLTSMTDGVKLECVYCHNYFRWGGMKRHLMSKHPERVTIGLQDDGIERRNSFLLRGC